MIGRYVDTVDYFVTIMYDNFRVKNIQIQHKEIKKVRQVMTKVIKIQDRIVIQKIKSRD